MEREGRSEAKKHRDRIVSTQLLSSAKYFKNKLPHYANFICYSGPKSDHTWDSPLYTQANLLIAQFGGRKSIMAVAISQIAQKDAAPKRRRNDFLPLLDYYLAGAPEREHGGF